MWAIGCDQAGDVFKDAFCQVLAARGLTVWDMGSHLDYTAATLLVARAVSEGKAEGGILICGTGIGMAMAANKFPGVRAALCHDVFSAKATRSHNDANILTMGARVIGLGHAMEILNAFVDTPFSGEERHIRRVQAITSFERPFPPDA